VLTSRRRNDSPRFQPCLPAWAVPSSKPLKTGPEFMDFASSRPTPRVANEASQKAHAALGFSEVGRVVVYRKVL
jgi:hypothetical protein